MVKNKNRKNSAVKQAVDYLPDGIAFFSEDDLLILSNHVMNGLAQKLMGTDLQLLSELLGAVSEPDAERAVILKDFGNALKFADGSVWRFTDSDISDGSGHPVRQIAAYNLNEQYSLYEELQKRNGELLKMQERLNSVRYRIADSVREQEILTAKMRVHSKMGGCMVLLRHYLRGNHDSGEKEQLLEAFRQMTGELKQEIDQTDEPSVIGDIIRIAAGMGLEIRLAGEEIPENALVTECLTMALRECITNTLRHSGGTVITVTLARDADWVAAAFQDNGEPPAGEIMLGGGLSNLKQRLAGAGALMEVEVRPAFSLKVRIPCGGELNGPL